MVMCHNYTSRHKLYCSRIKTPRVKSLPPTTPCLQSHTLRAHLQCMYWKAAADDAIPEIDPTDYGWELKDSTLWPVSNVPAIAPAELLEVTACKCSAVSPCSRNTCSCKKNKTACTCYCKCGGSEGTCCNDITPDSTDHSSHSHDGSDEEEC